MKLYKYHTRLIVQSNFFTQRIINSWNNLPQKVVSVISVASFKLKLGNHWMSSGYGYEQRGLLLNSICCTVNYIYPYNNNNNALLSTLAPRV